MEDTSDRFPKVIGPMVIDIRRLPYARNKGVKFLTLLSLKTVNKAILFNAGNNCRLGMLESWSTQWLAMISGNDVITKSRIFLEYMLNRCTCAGWITPLNVYTKDSGGT